MIAPKTFSEHFLRCIFTARSILGEKIRKSLPEQRCLGSSCSVLAYSTVPWPEPWTWCWVSIRVFRAWKSQSFRHNIHAEIFRSIRIYRIHIFKEYPWSNEGTKLMVDASGERQNTRDVGSTRCEAMKVCGTGLWCELWLSGETITTTDLPKQHRRLTQATTWIGPTIRMDPGN